MRIKLLSLLAALFLVTGCTSFRGIKPLYPGVGNPNFPTVTESLQPVFSWEPAPGREVSYDFIIYEGIKTESFMEGVKRAVGEEIYYRQDLKTAEHRIEEALKPDKEYYWSVRVRRGEQVTEWALYDYTLFLGTAYVAFHNQPFLFKTPKD